MSRQYLLSPTAIQRLREHKRWSLDRFGVATTKKYFQDIDKGFNYIANNHERIAPRPDLFGKSGVSIYPVREHYVVFFPMKDVAHIVDILRQSQDIPNIINENLAQFQRELAQMK